MDAMVTAMGEIFRVEIFQDSSGFFVAKSHDLPNLFLMEDSAEDVVQKVSGVIEAMLKAERQQEYRVVRAHIQDQKQRAWVAFPAHLAAQCLDAGGLGAGR